MPAKPNLPGMAAAGMTKERPLRLLAAPIRFSKESGMSHSQAEEPLTEPRRKEIFLALVDAQDHEMTVAQSRKLIADRFGLAESQIRDIEREGLDNQWPPL
jgi:hypothetical protein